MTQPSDIGTFIVKIVEMSPVRVVLLGVCLTPYLLALLAIHLLKEQVQKKTSVVLGPPAVEGVERAFDLWNYETTLVNNGIARAKNFAHLFGFVSSATIGACAMIFMAVPMHYGCASGGKLTGLSGVAITTGVAVAVAAGLALASMFVRVANNDASARMFANAFKSLVSTIIAAFAIAALLFVTGQSDLIKQSLGYLVVGALVGVWGDSALDYFATSASALVKAPVITPQKRADLQLIDGLTEEDIQRLAEESVDSLHALAFVPTPRLFFNTKYSLQRICDLQDQALMVKYVGPEKAKSFRATLLIRGAMDLRQLAHSILCSAKDPDGKTRKIVLRTACTAFRGQPLAPQTKANHEEVYKDIEVDESEWQKMFNILGFSSADQGKIALSNIVDDEVIKRLVVFYESAPHQDTPESSSKPPLSPDLSSSEPSRASAGQTTPEREP